MGPDPSADVRRFIASANPDGIIGSLPDPDRCPRSDTSLSGVPGDVNKDADEPEGTRPELEIEGDEESSWLGWSMVEVLE